MPPGAVWDSNRTTLLALLHQQGYQTIDLKIAKDTTDAIYGKLCQGLDRSDVLISTGGVSMGEKDLLKQILQIDFDANIHFGRVNVKPGKPTTFATCTYNGKKKFIFALPGNPVSAFVCCHLFTLPALRFLSGQIPATSSSPQNILSHHRTTSVRLKLDKDSIRLDVRPEFVRAIIDYSEDEPVASLTGNQRSSRLMSVKDANALIFLPAKSTNLSEIKSGSKVKAILL